MLRKLALAVIATLATLLVLELAVRVANLEVNDFGHELRKYATFLYRDDRGYFTHPAGMRVHLGGVDVAFNSLGMRDDEPRIPKPPGVFRILCIGDSVVFAPAVPQDRTYPARLRTMVGGPHVDVVAVGVQGWNTIEEEHFLVANMERLQPDLVVLLYVTNDNEPVEPWRVAKQPPPDLETRLHRWLVLNSRLYEWANFVWVARLGKPDWPLLSRIANWTKERQEAGPPFAPDEPGWLESRSSLGRILELCRTHGARFVVFLHRLGNLPPAPTAWERLNEFGAETGVPIFDTLPFFEGYNAVDLMNRQLIDPHPNVRGQELLASGIARTLREAHLLPTDQRAK